MVFLFLVFILDIKYLQEIQDVVIGIFDICLGESGLVFVKQMRIVFNGFQVVIGYF